MWLTEELRKLDPDRTELRKFALIFGGALVAFGGLAWYRGSELATWLGVPGATVILVGLALPQALRWLFFVWMAIGLVLGTIVTGIILTIIFLIAVTPIGLVMRLSGRDPMHRKLDPGARSYWIPKSPNTDRGRLEKYF